ncbi:MAG TPA: SDR family oxidoreductase, partial [Coxiellaceae bacterium]|nr:SDR family oxidoreductase [Coxiellaceae bacterium]
KIIIMMSNRCFLITGATKGIGLATSIRLAKQGHEIIGIAREKPDYTFPGKIYLADLSDEHKSEAIFNEINSQHEVDGIVNNVGIAIPAYLDQISLSDFREVLNLNLCPAVLATQIFKAGMLARHWGRIINISSLAVLGLANRSTYAAAKSALIALSRSWALELAPTGITVNVVAPGPTETERFRLYRPKGSEEERKSLNRVPMGRIGQPQEIAAAIEFLLSNDASFITGQTLFVDGGASVGQTVI